VSDNSDFLQVTIELLWRGNVRRALESARLKINKKVGEEARLSYSAAHTSHIPRLDRALVHLKRKAKCDPPSKQSFSPRTCAPEA
jgi:hypothetical protein